MSSLLELQRDCYRAFLFGDAAALLPRLAGTAGAALARVRVHQSNARETYRQALACVYPTVERLVGEPCFATLARMYMREHPSRCGDIQAYGRDFPVLLEARYGGSPFGYLTDVAHLEWAVESVLTEAEGVRLDAAALGQVAPELLADIVFEISPSVRFVESGYPILDIWRTNQRGEERNVDLSAGPQYVAVRRQAGEAELVPLELPAIRLAQAFLNGVSLGAACHALAGSTGSSAARALAALLRHGCLSGFAAPTPPSVSGRRQAG